VKEEDVCEMLEEKRDYDNADSDNNFENLGIDAVIYDTLIQN
jgi:hypothetical protein